MDDIKICGDGITVHKYVDILSDAGFKAVFGDRKNKDVLMDFLNVVLPEHRRVKEIEYATTEIPGFTPQNKSVRLDLRCTGEDGTKFIVEMQSSHQKHFFKRCVEYAAKVYDSGSSSGGRYEDIPPVYFIGILASDMGFDRSADIWKDKYISNYVLMEKDTHEFAEETINIIFVELNRFSKSPEECRNLVEKWCYALKHVGRLETLPEKLKTEAFERLFRACEIAKFNPEKKLRYEKEMITERDYINILETAREDGFEAGLAEGKNEGLAAGIAMGREQGMSEARHSIAKAMMDSGMDISRISALTGLSEAEINKPQ